MSLNIVIRADASLEIGTGHVMRCLTLAKALEEMLEASVRFLCRPHNGNLIDYILEEGFDVCELPPPDKYVDGNLTHSRWLGTTQEEDATQCLELLKNRKNDWLIVDHYALDITWEKMVAINGSKILAIDDLADREHIADIVLDQTYGRKEYDYSDLVERGTTVVCGSNYALIRAEFSDMREYSFDRRREFLIENLLVNLGGVDKDNYTDEILRQLDICDLPDLKLITVVMGRTSPWVDMVTSTSKNMRYPVQVITGAKNMAELMANSDLAIGAAGSTSWERCSVGLPTIQIAIAGNQRLIAEQLEKAEAIKLIKNVDELPFILSSWKSWLRATSKKCRRVSDGRGATRLIEIMRGLI